MCANNSNCNKTNCYSCSVTPPSIQSGAAGVGVSTATVTNGELIITLTNGVVINAGAVAGTNGTNGLGIADITYNNNNQLVITYTDSTSDTFTLKDKTFFIANNETATTDVLGVSLVSPSVIAGDTRFNKDTGSFQVFNGTSWVKHLSVGNTLIYNNSDTSNIPLSVANLTGTSVDQSLTSFTIFQNYLDKLEINDTLKATITGSLSNAFVDAAIALGTAININHPAITLDIRDNLASVVTNPLVTETTNTNMNAFKFSLATLVAMDKFPSTSPFYFKYIIIFTKLSSNTYNLSVHLEKYIYAPLFIESVFALQIGLITKTTLHEEVITNNNNLIINLRYKCNNNSMPSIPNGIKISNFMIEKIQK